MTNTRFNKLALGMMICSALLLSACGGGSGFAAANGTGDAVVIMKLTGSVVVDANNNIVDKNTTTPITPIMPDKNTTITAVDTNTQTVSPLPMLPVTGLTTVTAPVYVEPIVTPVTPVTPTKITLTTGKGIVVTAGDEIKPLTTDTVIQVTHDVNNVKTVTLISGSAELIKGDYVLK